MRNQKISKKYKGAPNAGLPLGVHTTRVAHWSSAHFVKDNCWVANAGWKNLDSPRTLMKNSPKPKRKSGKEYFERKVKSRGGLRSGRNEGSGSLILLLAFTRVIGTSFFANLLSSIFLSGIAQAHLPTRAWGQGRFFPEPRFLIRFFLGDLL